MREIKFKAWDKQSEIMFTIFDSASEDWYLPKWKDRYEVMEFTGLRDNERTEEYPEGQDIYEGDIFQHQFGNKIRGIIKLGEYQNPNDDNHGGHVGFYVDWKGDNGLYRKDLAYWVKVSHVIGNIYENPELLGEKE